MFDDDGRLGVSDGPVVARVLFSGDLCPINRLEAMLAGGDVDGAFGTTRRLFRRADLTVVNLEAPLCAVQAPTEGKTVSDTDGALPLLSRERVGVRVEHCPAASAAPLTLPSPRGGEGGNRCLTPVSGPIDKLGPNFRADPAIALALAAAPIHVACLANNHTMDQGAGGLRETLAALDAAGIRHVGAGATPAAARAPLCLTVKGTRVALLNAAVVEGALPLDGPGAARIDHIADRRAVVHAAREADAVIAVLHLGKEQVLFPSPGLQARCRDLIDAGATAVVCHHPHVPQGIEVYNGRPIAYSLGNFLFDWPEPEPETDSSFLLELGLGPSSVVEIAVHPFVRTASGGAALLTGRDKIDYLAFIADLSRPLTDGAALDALWREQCRALFDVWYRPRLKRLVSIDADDPRERRRAQLTILNLIQNAEHGEVLNQAVASLATDRAQPDAEARAVLDRLMGRLKRFAGMGQTG